MVALLDVTFHGRRYIVVENFLMVELNVLSTWASVPDPSRANLPHFLNSSNWRLDVEIPCHSRWVAPLGLLLGA